MVFILSLSLLFANLNLNAVFAQSLLVAGNNLSSNSPTISQPPSSNAVKPRDTVVTSCNEASFKQALAAGGYISFNCGPNPVTITFTSYTKAVVTQTNAVVDGGGLVTLSGDNATRVFSVTNGISFYIKTFHKQIKQLLGLSDNQCHSERSVKRMWTLVLIAYSYLMIERVEHGEEYRSGRNHPATLGEVVREHQKQGHQALVEWVYNEAKLGTSLAELVAQIGA